MADKDKDNLIYINMKSDFIILMKNVSLVSWLLIYISDLVYFFAFKEFDSKFQLSNCHLVLVCVNILVPILISIGEAWSNAVIHNLFDIL